MAERTITLTFKSGGTCQHTFDRDEDGWRKLGLDIGLEWAKTTPGILRLQNPYGLHLLSEVAAFHIPEYEPPEEERHIGLV